MCTFRRPTRCSKGNGFSARVFEVLNSKDESTKENVMNISNKSVLITGANRGIGRALLDEALRRGAKKVYAGTRGALQHPDERCGHRHLRRSEQSRRARTDLRGQFPRFAQSDQRVLAAAETLQRGHRQRLVPGRARSPTDHTFLLSIKGRRAQLDAVTESALGRPRRDGPCSRPRPRGHRYEPRLQHTESLD